MVFHVIFKHCSIVFQHQLFDRSCDTCEDIGEEGVSNHSEEERELEEILTKVSEEERKVTKRLVCIYIYVCVCW